jgi:hypothetical protein
MNNELLIPAITAVFEWCKDRQKNKKSGHKKPEILHGLSACYSRRTETLSRLKQTDEKQTGSSHNLLRIFSNQFPTENG